uniref:Retroviral envelope protein GP41-like domain-containing protein n=1 Tax=Amphiprion ocellaris TaxID=80972 RepID=A0A3Q1B6C2_AMPOC
MARLLVLLGLVTVVLLSVTVMLFTDPGDTSNRKRRSHQHSDAPPYRTPTDFHALGDTNCTEELNHSLPGGMVCSEKVNLQSDSTAVTTYGDPPVVFVGVFNATWWFAGTNKTTYNNSDRFLTIIPNKTPPGMMWQCGGMLYWYLPWNWCGTCTLVYLQPAVTIITDTQLASCTSHAHRIKERDTEEQNPAISEINRFFMTLIPAYGTANLATQVNQLWFSLKNLTDTVLELEGQLETDPELEAVKQMTLQNRMALDLLLAAQGGVCEMVGDHCCTYIPDHKGNYTLIRDKLNAIKQNIMSHQDTWSDFNMSSWFFSGSWRSILIRVCTIILTIFVLLCIITSCIIPCVRTMMTKMLTTALIQYTAVQIEEDSEEDEKDGNAFV